MFNDFNHRLRLDFVPLVLLFLAFPAHAYQNLAIATGEPDFFRNPVTNFTSARFAANDPIYNTTNQTVTTTRPYNVVGTDGKTYQATITKSAAADISKVGPALSKFAQRVGPLAMAIATVDLICNLSSICQNPATNNFEKAVSGTFAGTYPSCESAAGYPSGELSGCITARANFSNIYWWRAPDLPPSNAGCSLVANVGYAYVARGYTCTGQPQSTYTPLTSADWQAAEPLLSTASAADRLAAEYEPLPVQAPLPFWPQAFQTSKSTVTTKDALGNATGTQTTTRQLSIEDAATIDEPYRVTVKEIDTVTNYDLNNQPLSSTESVSEQSTQPQNEPQKIDFPDYQAEFDTVTDTELPTSEFSADFNPVSWGSSASCPPDLTTTVRGVNLAIRTAPICDAAETFRPLILVLAALSAAGIALGVRTRGAD